MARIRQGEFNHRILTMNNQPTPHEVIVNTIGREYQAPKLNPPKFKVELAPAPNPNTLKKIMEQLASEDNEFNPC